MGVDTPSLRQFLPHHGKMVAAWVRDEQELFWVAPSTKAPLTAAKVAGWTERRGEPFLMCPGRRAEPIGYGELSPLRDQTDHLWIGHLILDPASRGKGWGLTFVQMLLMHAFHRLSASRVSLMVFPDNRPAIRCYVEAGFQIRDDQYHIFGQPPKRYRMLHMLCTAGAAEAHISRRTAQLSPK